MRVSALFHFLLAVSAALWMRRAAHPIGGAHTKLLPNFYIHAWIVSVTKHGSSSPRKLHLSEKNVSYGRFEQFVLRRSLWLVPGSFNEFGFSSENFAAAGNERGFWRKIIEFLIGCTLKLKCSESTLTILESQVQIINLIPVKLFKSDFIWWYWRN